MEYTDPIFISLQFLFCYEILQQNLPRHVVNDPIKLNEAWFYVSRYINSQNMYIWNSENFINSWKLCYVLKMYVLVEVSLSACYRSDIFVILQTSQILLPFHALDWDCILSYPSPPTLSISFASISIFSYDFPSFFPILFCLAILFSVSLFILPKFSHF